MSSLHRDLLEQAGHLARKEPKRPKQASLRRAVSTAYYALFHLLIDEATVLLLTKTKNKALRHSLGRAFRHTTMRKVSAEFAKGRIPPKLQSGNASLQPQPELQFVAETFCALQEARHDADYNLARRFSRETVVDVIEGTREAFESWRLIRRSEVARIYLTGLLILDSIQGGGK